MPSVGVNLLQHVQSNVPWKGMLMIDSNYLDVFSCWWDNYRASGSHTRLFIGALDSRAFTVLRTLQREQASGRRLPFMLYRMPEGKLGLLQSGISPPSFVRLFWNVVHDLIQKHPGGVLHSDADAMWIRNPDSMLRDALRAHTQADLVAQVSFGATWHDAFKAWGFVLNTGFVLFRRTTAVQRMINTFRATFNETLYEQGVLNTYLLNLGCRWSQAMTNMSRKLSVGHCGDMTVLALPPAQVSRALKRKRGGRLRVYHPDLQQTKLADLKQMGVCRP